MVHKGNPQLRNQELYIKFYLKDVIPNIMKHMGKEDCLSHLLLSLKPTTLQLIFPLLLPSAMSEDTAMTYSCSSLSSVIFLPSNSLNLNKKLK